MTRNELVMALFEMGFRYSQIARLARISRGAVAGIVYRNRQCEPDQVKAASRRRVA